MGCAEVVVVKKAFDLKDSITLEQEQENEDPCLFMCICCREKRHGVVSSFDKPLDITMMRTAMSVHDDYLCFCGDFGEVFFDTISDSCTNVMRELLCIFEGRDVVQRKVVIGFTFAVSSDVEWEHIGPLKII